MSARAHEERRASVHCQRGELGACKAALKRSQVALAVYALAMAIHLLVVNHVLAEEHGGVLF